MNPEPTRISRRRLINKATKLEIINAARLSNKTLLKILNRHNINKTLTRILNRTPNERSELPKSDLVRGIELNELSHDELKKPAKLRKICNYGQLSKKRPLLYTAEIRKSTTRRRILKIYKIYHKKRFKRTY